MTKSARAWPIAGLVKTLLPPDKGYDDVKILFVGGGHIQKSFVNSSDPSLQTAIIFEYLHEYLSIPKDVIKYKMLNL